MPFVVGLHGFYCFEKLQFLPFAVTLNYKCLHFYLIDFYFSITYDLGGIAEGGDF